jgi:hypothetical protein
MLPHPHLVCLDTLIYLCAVIFFTHCPYDSLDVEGKEMKDSVEITVVFKREDAEKLRKLAGNDSDFSKYLTKVIDRLYSEQTLFGGDLKVDNLISVAEKLATQNSKQKETIRALQDRLKKLSRTEEVLMAQVEYHKSMAYQARKNLNNSHNIQ